MNDESGPGPSGQPGDATSTPPPPPVSPDGKFWWDGTRWLPFVSHDAASAAGNTSPTYPAPPVPNQAGPRVIPPRTQGLETEAPSGKKSGFRWSWVFRAVVPLAVLIWFLVPKIADSMRAPGSDTSSGSLNQATCDDLADEAVRISAEDAGLGAKLLKVREARTVEDNRDTYQTPTGSDEALVLACRGEGAWSDGSKIDVRIELSVDSDGESWVFFKGI